MHDSLLTVFLLSLVLGRERSRVFGFKRVREWELFKDYLKMSCLGGRTEEVFLVYREPLRPSLVSSNNRARPVDGRIPYDSATDGVLRPT